MLNNCWVVWCVFFLHRHAFLKIGCWLFATPSFLIISTNSTKLHCLHLSCHFSGMMSRRDAEILYGWLERAALAHHFEAFQRSNIGISQLVTLGQNDYAAFGIVDLTDRRKMFDLNSLLRWLRFLRSFLVPAFNVPLQFMFFFHVPTDHLNHPHKLSRNIFVLTRLDPIQLIKKTNYFDTCVDMEIEDEKENREDLLNLQVRFFSFFSALPFSLSARLCKARYAIRLQWTAWGKGRPKGSPCRNFEVCIISPSRTFF